MINADLPEVLLFEPAVFADDRGFLFESFQRKTFEAATGTRSDFTLELHSRSTRGVVRGIHYQLAKPQGKLIRAAQGEVFEVAVDLRRSSPRFGTWCGAFISAANRRSIWIPRGFGHAFLVLSEAADMLYKLDDDYDPASSRAIRWDDPAIAIQWPELPGGSVPIQSPRDRVALPLANAEVFD